MNALSNNWAVVRTSLAEDKVRRATRINIEETAFLPAALEVIERPVSPTARMTARVMLVGLIALAAWLIFGRTEIVASANGRVVPVGAVQLVQPAAPGVVRRIMVHDGDHVVRGQPLVTLDPTVSTAEAAQAQAAWETAAFDAARTRTVLDALDGRGFVFQAPEGSNPQLAAVQESFARASLTDVEATIRTRASAMAMASADIAGARAQAAKLSETLPLLDEQLAANEQLLAKGYVSKMKVLAMRSERIAQVRDREAALQAIRRAGAQASGAADAMAKARSEVRAQLLDQLVKATADSQLRREELVKARQRASFQVLRAPVAGTIGQLAVHTEGGVVEATKPIMTVVPDTGGLVAEVQLLNRDAGFVSIGQKVQLKLDAFPFSRYGTIPGRITSISPDAVEDQKLGLVYIVRVALDKTVVDRGDKRIRLFPGMTATADIITGNRSFLSYLVSPIDEVKGNALRER